MRAVVTYRTDNGTQEQVEYDDVDHVYDLEDVGVHLAADDIRLEDLISITFKP